MSDNYREAIRREIEQLTSRRPETAAEVIAILRECDPMEAEGCSGDAFSSTGGYSGEYLWEYLPGSWLYRGIESPYWFTLVNRNTGAVLEYVEGDVYDRTPRRGKCPATGRSASACEDPTHRKCQAGARESAELDRKVEAELARLDPSY